MQAMINVKINENGSLANETFISKVTQPNDSCVTGKASPTETRFALLGNLYLSEGENGKVCALFIIKTQALGLLFFSLSFDGSQRIRNWITTISFFRWFTCWPKNELEKKISSQHAEKPFMLHFRESTLVGQFFVIFFLQFSLFHLFLHFCRS